MATCDESPGLAAGTTLARSDDEVTVSTNDSLPGSSVLTRI